MTGIDVTLETYIHVRWIWLLLPLIMVVFGTLFLAVTLWQSRRWNIPNWRISAPALYQSDMVYAYVLETRTNLAPDFNPEF